MFKFYSKISIACLALISFFPLNAQFTNVSGSTGIAMTHDGESISEFMDVGSGVAWLDYDQDGDQDLYMTMRAGANFLYRNDGGSSFTNVAGTAMVEDATGDGAGVAIADFNNDGWPDIYLANGDEDVLFKNNGDNTFTDITATANLTGTGTRRGTSASWGDYDNDGYLDLYVSHHRPVGTGSYPITDVQDFLFHNDGDETFTDVSSMLGIADLQGHGFIGGWTDYDLDGDMDIILINDCIQEGVGIGTEGTKVFRNDGGTDGVTNWSFTEVAHSIGIIDPTDASISDCRNGMGIGVGDFNRDGWMDFYYTNIGHVVLFKNIGGTFTNVSDPAGVETQPAHYFSWGASFIDYDMDGYQDIMTAIGSLDIPANLNPQHNMLFKNNGDETFSDVADVLNIDDPKKTRHIVYADYDGDGDQDFLVFNYGETPMLMRNDISNGFHYLMVDLNGVDSNKDGIGSKLKITLPDGTIQYFETRSGSNLGGGDALYAYFGLENNATVSELEINWPSGTVQTLTNIAADQTIEVTEDSALPVELTSFDAIQKDADVLLTWTTLSESRNAFFAIERKASSGAFEEIGRVLGNGTTLQTSDYTFTDTEPLQGENYYRLRQIDLNELSSLSAIRLVNIAYTSTEISIAPNPVRTNTFSLNYKGPEEEINYILYDLFGKTVVAGMVQHDAPIDINVSDLSNGMYILRITGQDTQHSEKIMITQ